MNRERCALTALFTVHGAVVGTWVGRIPAVKSVADLGYGGLGVALMAMGLGTFCALPFSGTLLARWSSGRMTGYAAIATCAMLAATGAAAHQGSFAAFLAVLFAFGGTMGLMDVAMNAHASALEQAAGRSIMSSFHAFWSLGTLGAAALGSWAAGTGLSPLSHFSWAAGTLGLGGWLAWRRLADAPPAAQRSALAWPSAEILAIGLVGAAGAIVEGGVADWCGVYLSDHFHAAPSLAAAGYVAFALAMLSGRLMGDRLLDRLGHGRVLQWGALLAAVSLASALLTPSPLWAIAAFAIAGWGVSPVFPIAFSLAGKQGGTAPGTAVAVVAAMSYGSGLGGPPVIGFLSEGVSLPTALWLLVAMCVAMAWLGSRMEAKAALPG